nr:uncharacterized protein LOC106678529 [Halyomorpha halys]
MAVVLLRRSGLNRVLKKDQLFRVLKKSSNSGKIHNMLETRQYGKETAAMKNGKDRRRSIFIQSTSMVDTLKDPEHQKEVTLAYHQEKTNHRELNETQQALRHKYFWWGMKHTIQEMLGKCEVCLRTKYDRHPSCTAQEETSTALRLTGGFFHL